VAALLKAASALSGNSTAHTRAYDQFSLDAGRRSARCCLGNDRVEMSKTPDGAAGPAGAERRGTATIRPCRMTRTRSALSRATQVERDEYHREVHFGVQVAQEVENLPAPALNR
jgi:hypothetical protein